ncbi:hypothetical protein EYD45_09970 [Hyunsoonleella flava]|uniref:Uncharacterized protein n=1 Tax=Hyunsoonleella flava TaxID=2527939 RepID=A0A4Q9FCM0_9FLAO|nr:hypothetical protein [Hyunsoonleella flava]TBN03325.1 hypothetical protein EYD45_09970 [Hyunsoonleella flava]
MSIIFFVCSCNDDDRIDNDLIINYNGCVNLSDTKFTICLDSIQDSRCPTGLVCVWEGDAATYFSLDNGQNIKSITLHTNTIFQQDTLIDGLRIKLLDVSPYPDKNVEPDISKYKARIEVIRE